MEKIFVVKAYGGEFDDSWEENLYAVRGQEAAELAVMQETERHERLCKAKEKIFNVYHRVLNSLPKDIRDIPSPPRGPARPTKETTEAHRQAAEKWREIAEPIQKHNAAEYSRVQAAASIQAKNKAIELGLNDEDLVILGFRDGEDYYSHRYNSDRQFHFEELELL